MKIRNTLAQLETRWEHRLTEVIEISERIDPMILAALDTRTATAKSSREYFDSLSDFEMEIARAAIRTGLATIAFGLARRKLARAEAQP